LIFIFTFFELFFNPGERNGLLSCLYFIECANLKKVKIMLAFSFYFGMFALLEKTKVKKVKERK